MNLRRQMNIIKSTETRNAQIIVFPEGTLNWITEPAVVPKVEDNAVPCNSNKYSEVIRNISCAAKEAQKYVVIQVYMQRNCNDDIDDDVHDILSCIHIYNTAVAFDRTGQVVAV